MNHQSWRGNRNGEYYYAQGRETVREAFILHRRTLVSRARVAMSSVVVGAARAVAGATKLAQAAAAFSGEHRHVIDYLAAEVMRQQPQLLQDFLRKTCILDRFPADLCDALPERTDSRQMVVQVERANLFLRWLDDQGRRFRYYQVLADFLREGLAESERSSCIVGPARGSNLTGWERTR